MRPVERMTSSTTNHVCSEVAAGRRGGGPWRVGGVCVPVERMMMTTTSHTSTVKGMKGCFILVRKLLSTSGLGAERLRWVG